MRTAKLLCTFLIVGFCCGINGQIKRTTIPLGDAVHKSLDKISLTGSGAQPFHIVLSISEPENPQSPYQGTFEEWWVSSSQWRREVTIKNGMRQTIVVSSGQKTEQDAGDYFPLWLRRFVLAVTDPIPDAAVWTANGGVIEQITMPDGRKSDACARGKFKIGIGDHATDAFSNVCFDGHGLLNFYGSPRYDMEFQDYRGFGKKQIAHKLIDHPEPGTELVGEVTVLEDESKAKTAQDLFNPLTSNDDRFETIPVNSQQMEQLSTGNPPIVWPPVHSGSVRGRLAIYVSVDNEGRVREAWPLNSDNAGLDDSVREQVSQWKLKSAVNSAGKHVQVDGGLSFAFETKIGDPLPQLSDAEVRALATKVVEPVWPADSVKSGQIIEAEISINEQGTLTGVGFNKVPNELIGPINVALSKWSFRPLMRDGKPQSFHAVVKFTVP